jgi:hypothetical protein
VPDQVEELPADLLGGQAVELPHGVGPDLAQGPEQAEQGVLEHVAGLLPAGDVGEAAEHAAGQPLQPGGDAAEQLLAGAGVPGLHPGQPAVQLGGVRRRRG